MKFTLRSLLFPAFFSLGLAGCAHDSGMGSHHRDSAAAAYPMDTCIVSGEKLGEMGKPVTVTVKDHTFMLCCAGCEKKLRENPDKYIQKLEEAEKSKTPAPGDTHTDGHH